jgi:predicted nucleotidyltransferase component of viral defense system
LSASSQQARRSTSTSPIKEVVLHYALARLNEIGLVGYQPGEQTPGPLLFKGGTALRKCIFGSTGRFSQDIDLDATHKNGFEETVETAFQPGEPYHGIEFSLPHFRYSSDDNFSGTVEYRHANGEGAFELQISYRLDPILEPVDLTLQSSPTSRKPARSAACRVSSASIPTR